LVVVALVITPLVANRLVEVAAVVVERVITVSARFARPDTVTEPRVPTEVREELVTPAARVLPVSDPAGAEPLIEPEMVFVTKR
jgi:hypothetical protein